MKVWAQCRHLLLAFSLQGCPRFACSKPSQHASHACSGDAHIVSTDKFGATGLAARKLVRLVLPVVLSGRDISLPPAPPLLPLPPSFLPSLCPLRPFVPALSSLYINLSSPPPSSFPAPSTPPPPSLSKPS